METLCCEGALIPVSEAFVDTSRTLSSALRVAIATHARGAETQPLHVPFPAADIYAAVDAFPGVLLATNMGRETAERRLILGDFLDNQPLVELASVALEPVLE
jgi:hypothetical protein